MNLESIHIELTSRCILSCPACARTDFIKKFKRPFPKMDLDNAKLAAFLDCKVGRTVKEFSIQGNHGDCIYYPKLFEFIDFWRSSKTFEFWTNGSGRDERWWKKFADKLIEGDKVIFSIDGLKDSNEEYRINSDWDSVIKAVEIVSKSRATVIWKAILFKTNQEQIDEITETAKLFGVDEFVLETTHRFGDDEKFKPIKFIDLKSNKQSAIIPRCKDYKKLYISADGLLAPCCWVHTFYTLHQTEFWKQRDKWSIDNTTLTKFMKDAYLDNFVNRISHDYDSAYSVCKDNCNANGKFIKEYEQRIQF